MRTSLLVYSKHSVEEVGAGGSLETWSLLEKLRMGGSCVPGSLCGSSGFEPPILSPQIFLKAVDDCAVDTDPEGAAAGLSGPLTLVQSWTSLYTQS